MVPSRTLLILAESPGDAAGIEALAAEARPGIPWNALVFPGVPGDESAFRRADLVVALPTFADDARKRAGTKMVDLRPDLPPPRLYHPLPEAPSRKLERILLADGDVDLARVLARRTAVTLASRSPTTFLAWPDLQGIAVRTVVADSAWLDLLARHDLVVTEDVELALLANALLKPAVLVGGADPALPFAFAVARGEIEDVIGRYRPEESLPDLVNWKRAGQAGWVAALDGALSAQGL